MTPDWRDPLDPGNPGMNPLSLQVDVQMQSKSMAPTKTLCKVDSFYGNLNTAADLYQLVINGIP